MKLDDLETFVRMADRGTITGAAQELGVPKSTVSRRIARLEDDLGVALLRRTARSVALTDRGEHLRARCAPALRDIAEAVRAVRELDDHPRGLLRITAPSDLGVTRAFTELFVGFRKEWPEVTLEIDLSERRVDLVREGFDVALRARGRGPLVAGEGLMARSLGRVSAGIFGSPAYLAGRGSPGSPSDLEAHDWVVHGPATPDAVLPLTCPSTGEVVSVALSQVVRTNSMGQVLAMVEQGAGLGALPEFLAAPQRRDGSMVQVLPGWQVPGGQVDAVWPATRHLSPKLRAFLDYAFERLDLRAGAEL